jgi:hypothetical protein
VDTSLLPHAPVERKVLMGPVVPKSLEILFSEVRGFASLAEHMGIRCSVTASKAGYVISHTGCALRCHYISREENALSLHPRKPRLQKEAPPLSCLVTCKECRTGWTAAAPTR